MYSICAPSQNTTDVESRVPAHKNLFGIAHHLVVASGEILGAECRRVNGERQGPDGMSGQWVGYNGRFSDGHYRPVFAITMRALKLDLANTVWQ